MTQETIQINGTTYLKDALPARVKMLIDVYTKWQSELNDAKIEVAKIEAALRDLGREIQQEMTAIEQLVQSKVPPAQEPELPQDPA